MIKWGIIGLGNMGQKFANAIKETSNSKIISVASLDKNKTKNFKDNYNLNEVAVYNNYDEIIKDVNLAFNCSFILINFTPYKSVD